MKKILFGLKIEEYSHNDSKDFEEYIQKNETDNNNPYGGTFFSDSRNMPQPNKDAERRITSIPSPYARMHLTDLAFEELAMHNLDTTNISSDYIKAMSHCLDMFELFFRFDQLDLLEKGIKVERTELVSGKLGNVNKWSEFLSAEKNKNVRQYIETLDLFRLQYLKVIGEVDNPNFRFKFTDLYLFKDTKGRTFGSTSPFTGFFCTADCDLTELGISLVNHKLLTSNPQDWQMLNQRGTDFQDFMYILLNPDQKQGGLGNIFKNLYEVVRKTIANRENDLKTKNFEEQYPQYNFTDESLPRIKTSDNSELYLRSSEFDRSYMKYMLFFKQDEPVNFAIEKSLYDTPVANRKFPDGTNHNCPWVGVNDFLSDALFVLPYEISSDYVGIEYEDDSNKKKYRKCLVPIKSKALEYLPANFLKPEVANERISIRKYSDGHYTVSLKIDILTDGPQQTQMTIRREYWPNVYDDKLRIKGRVYEPSELDNFAFGIYPFVKSRTEVNIYKVLFYNQLKGRLSDNSLRVKFYFRDDNGKLASYISEEERQNQQNNNAQATTNSSCIYNYTSEYNSISNAQNTIYYDLETESVGKGIEFAEFAIADEDTTKTTCVYGTALIIPNLPEPLYTDHDGDAQQETRIAIDLGTSNTYIAYKHGDGEIQEINMVDSLGNAELRFMHKHIRPGSFTLDAKYEHDLCMQPSVESVQNKSNEEIKDLWLKNIPTQLCEFMPTYIMENKAQNIGRAFTFPIPTLITNLRYHADPNLHPFDRQNADGNRPLVHSTIPFAYYDIGKRSQDNAPRSNFKWLINPNTAFRSSENENSLSLFISELLFIVRSHMLCKAYNLSKCRIIWTYPLAFSYDDTNRLTTTTESIWQKQYLRYFQSDGNNVKDPSLYQKQIPGVAKTITINDLVFKTNESLSPYYYRLSGANAYQLLIDIGGGSTDVIGYDSGDLKFISSFEFAGNDLYLKKERKDGRTQLPDESNIVIRHALSLYQQYAETMNHSDFRNCIRINNAKDISSFMNYGFQKFTTDFNGLWLGKTDLQFLLKFHLGAILYQTLQLSNIFFENTVPEKIRLTGNGSKLFNLIPERSRIKLIKGICASALSRKQEEVSTNLVTVDNPKFAAAQGCLSGFKQIFGNPQAIKDVQDKSFITLGDGHVYKSIFGNGVVNGSDNKTMKEQVYQNVLAYIDLIYSIFEGENIPVSKRDLLHYLETETNKDQYISLNQGFDNLFFRYIISLMEGISIKLCEKLN